MKKEIDPKIQSAATSYAARFYKGTTLGHFVAFYLDGGGVLARRGTRTLNAMKTTAFEAAAFANFAMRAKGPAVWAPLGGLRGICVPYTQGAHICQSGNKRSPREKRMAFARLKKSP